MIATRAYPWKAPKANRQGKVILKKQQKSYISWRAWSDEVRIDLKIYYLVNGLKIYNDSVDLDMLFVIDSAGNPPDRTNLGKSFEDILQDIIYVNDRQVQGGDVRRVFIGESIVGRPGEAWEGPERIHMRVTSLS